MGLNYQCRSSPFKRQGVILEGLVGSTLFLSTQNTSFEVALKDALKINVKMHHPCAYHCSNVPFRVQFLRNVNKKIIRFSNLPN